MNVAEKILKQIDTNICTYPMKHQPPEVRERFVACFVGDVVIYAVALGVTLVTNNEDDFGY